jgi:hypothetical protein
MLHNPEMYPEPETFSPERFLKDGKVDRSILDPADVAFGFGRRICPGQQIAIEMLKLTAASVLSVFNLSKALDGTGREIEPTQEYHESVIRSVRSQVYPRVRIVISSLPVIPRSSLARSSHDRLKQHVWFGLHMEETEWTGSHDYVKRIE